MTSATFAYNFRTFCGGSKALSWLAAINIAVGLLYFLCRLVDALAGTGLCAAFGYLVLPSGFIPFMKIQIIREKNNLIWLFHKNLKINAVLENAFKCKIRHVFFSVKTFTEIIFYSSSLPAL